MTIRPVGPGSLAGDGIAALLNEIRSAVIELQAPTKPTVLASCLEADLPPAAENTGAIVYLTDTQKVAMSNGSTWTDPAGGAL